MKKLLIFSAVTAACLSTCVEPYDVTLDKYEELLVVDGMITNQDGPYTIKLIRTSSENNSGYESVSDATVVISDINGNSETLTQISAGVYQTAENGIRGEVGNSYKISITAYNGDVYESEYQELTEPGVIHSVYAELDFQNIDETSNVYEGYQFFVKTEIEDDSIHYFLWEPIETYEYHAEYEIEYYTVRGEVYNYPKPDTFKICWRTKRAGGIYTFRAENISGNIVNPVNFTSSHTGKLMYGYSLLVRQYSLNYEAYTYWKELSQLSGLGESLYNIQPFQTEGNIKNVNDESEVVLGWFTVAGSVEKRIFADPVQPQEPLSKQCVPNSLRWSNAIGYSWGNIVYGTTDEYGLIGAVGGSCIDCRQMGGTIIKPDFWIY